MAWASDANVKAKAKAINLVIASLPLAPHKLKLVRDGLRWSFDLDQGWTVLRACLAC
jgi:hypothetical protein